jgi:MFS family permease
LYADVDLVSQLGVVGGPLIGGALTEYATWRWCMFLPPLSLIPLTKISGFYINLPIGGLAAIALLLIKIPDSRERSETKKATLLSTLQKLDLVGFFLFAPFAIMFLLALEWGGTNYACNSATLIGLFCGAGVTLIIFAVWEHRVGDKAMFPYSMLRRRVVWSSCLVMAIFCGCLLIYSYYLPIYFQAVRGVSPALSGVYVLPGILSQMLLAVISGVLGESSSSKWVT